MSKELAVTKEIWVKNYLRYAQVVDEKLMSVALLTNGCIGAELGYANNMRLLLTANPKTFEITHKCCEDERFLNGPPCWHLAAGLDLIAFLHGIRLDFDRKPLGSVLAINRYAINAEGSKDLTSDYLLSRGYKARKGDFKLINLVEIPQVAFTPETTSVKKSWFSKFCEAFGRLSFSGGGVK